MTVYCAIVRDALTGEKRRIWATAAAVAKIEAEAYVSEEPEGRHLTVIQAHEFPQNAGALAHWLNIHFDGTES